MTGGEEQPLIAQFGCEHAADFPGANDGDHTFCIDSAVIDPADVQEQSSVAKVARCPALTSAPPCWLAVTA